MTLISLVIPCYNEQESIPIYFKTVATILNDFQKEYPMYEWEYWFINDGSNDSTKNELTKLNVEHPQTVHYIDFSRNFGKEAALLAGLAQAKGEYVCVMDVDLQDPPELIPQMIRTLATTDNDIVTAQRIDRTSEPKIRSFLADEFYAVMNHISKVKISAGSRDFRMMKRPVITAILSMPEYNRFSKGIFSWIGFKTKILEYRHRDRVAGKTHWSMKQLFAYSMEGIMDFSNVPLAIATWLGILLLTSSLAGLTTIFIQAAFFHTVVANWLGYTLVIALIGGVQLSYLGVVGDYIGKIYLETKQRPHYIIRDKH